MIESDFTKERWLPIEGWDGYDVSDMGRVRSWWGAGSGQQGRRAITDQCKLVGGYRTKSGHRTAAIYRNNSTEKRTSGIHVLVLEAFVGPRPPGMFCCHNDGDPSNNRLPNLRWDSPASNVIDTLKHGTHNNAILTEVDIPEIWRRLLAGESNVSIGSDYGVGGVSISMIRSGGSWSHITRYLEGWPMTRITDPVIPGKAPKEPIHAPVEFCDPDAEIWRIIEGWPAYRCSTFGRIQSRWEKAIGGRRNEMRMGDKWIDRATYANKDGHYFLWMSNGIDKKMRYVHSLVLSAFACPRPDGYVCCHIDGDKSNNHASNLRWDSIKANARDRENHKKSRESIS